MFSAYGVRAVLMRCPRVVQGLFVWCLPVVREVFVRYSPVAVARSFGLRCSLVVAALVIRPVFVVRLPRTRSTCKVRTGDHSGLNLA